MPRRGTYVFFLGGDSAIGGGSIIVNDIHKFDWKTSIYFDLIPALENPDIWFPFPTNLIGSKYFLLVEFYSWYSYFKGFL